MKLVWVATIILLGNALSEKKQFLRLCQLILGAKCNPYRFVGDDSHIAISLTLRDARRSGGNRR